MSDIKLSQLTALTSPNSSDLLLINDVSDTTQGASGSTKSITYRDLLGGAYDNIFNVKNYGAVGDGTTDDTSAIDSAYDALVTAGGGTLLFPVPDSYYKVTPGTLVFSSSVGMIIQGPGKYVNCLKTSAVSDDYIMHITGSNVLIRDLKIDGNYTSGATAGGFGLISLRDSSNVTIENCYITSSKRTGIKIYGDCRDVMITKSRINNCYNGIYSFIDGTLNTAPVRLSIVDNEFFNGWDQTGNDQTGGIKLSSGEVGIDSYGHKITGNYLVNVGLLGIELWGGTGSFSHCDVSNNIIKGTNAAEEFGISLNDCKYTTASNNVIQLYEGEFGIEIANNCVHCSVVGNNVNFYDSGGVQSTGAGVGITFNSGPAGATYTQISDNNITGANKGIQTQESNYTKITGNLISDCNVLIYLQRSNYATITNNNLIGPCATFFFVDNTTANLTDVDFSYNTLTGAASSNGLFGYNNSSSYTVTNMTVSYNNVNNATHGSSSYQWLWDNNELVNFRQYANSYKTGGSQIVLSDFSMPSGSNPLDYNSWTPTWTNVTKGNAVITAQYQVNGKTVEGDLYFKYGSSTSISGSIIFSLPVTSRSYPGTATLQVLGHGRGFDASTSLSANVFVNWKTTTTAVISCGVASGTYIQQTDTSATVPWTWAENDEIHVQFKYDLP